MLVNKNDGDYKLRSQLHQPPRPELAQLYSLKYSELQFSQSLSLILNCTSRLADELAQLRSLQYSQSQFGRKVKRTYDIISKQ